MPFVEAIWLALAQIRVQKLKSFFTLLGVTIGVMFLIAVISIVQGMSSYMENDFAAKMLGVNTFTLRRFLWFGDGAGRASTTLTFRSSRACCHLARDTPSKARNTSRHSHSTPVQSRLKPTQWMVTTSASRSTTFTLADCSHSRSRPWGRRWW